METERGGAKAKGRRRILSEPQAKPMEAISEEGISSRGGECRGET